MSAKPDTLTLRIIRDAELDANSADLSIVIEGSSVFSGSEAFRKAKELRELIAALKETGIEENRIKLRSVAVNSTSFALIKSASAKYSVTVKTVGLEILPAVLGVIASRKGANLTHLNWNYAKLQETRTKLRSDALALALQQARSEAETLGVRILGIYNVTENQHRDYNSEFIQASGVGAFGRNRSSAEQIGLELGNSTTVHLDLLVEFRISALDVNVDVDADKS